MYALLPALVAALFLGYGAYVVAQKGGHRLTLGFLLLCVAIACWQATWAAGFLVHDTADVQPWIRLGYLFILFLPTGLYHLAIALFKPVHEHRWLYLSYAVAAMLGGFDLFSNWLIDGHYTHAFGVYPKAGVLHPLHVLQTSALAFRTLYLLWRRAERLKVQPRMSFRLRMLSVLVYCFAAVDYACSYGLAFYPGAITSAAAMCWLLIMVKTRHEVDASVAVAANMAHDIRTPLLSIRLLAEGLAKHLSELHKGYQLAVAHGLMKPNIRAAAVEQLARVSRDISHHVTFSNTLIDRMLTHADMTHIDTHDFAWHSMHACVNEALAAYPFEAHEREKVTLVMKKDFAFYGTPPLMMLVLFNLLKNALYALKVVEKGSITLTLDVPEEKPTLTLTDTGCGIAADLLPYIFDAFVTSRPTSLNGLGLAFCRRVIAASNAQIACFSVVGEYTRFVLTFPAHADELETLASLRPTMTQAPATSDIHTSARDGQATDGLPVEAKEQSHDRAPSASAAASALAGSATPVAEKSAPETTRNNKTVILAEDDTNNREMMAGYLEDWGMTVIQARDGQEVLNCLAHHTQVDLILMDMQMPVMDGIETASAIRSQNGHHQQVPILALTGHSDQASIQAAVIAGMNGLVVKSGEMQTLREKIATVLSQADKR